MICESENIDKKNIYTKGVNYSFFLTVDNQLVTIIH